MEWHVWALALLCLVIFIITPISVRAVTVAPAVIQDLEIEPGGVAEGSFQIFNETNQTQTYQLVAKNFQARGENGEVSIVSEQTDDLAVWIKMTESAITLKPGEGTKVRFLINAPNNALPGGHYAAIFTSSTAGNGQGVTISSNLGVLVMVKIKGELKEDLRLLDFQTDKKFYFSLPVNFVYRLENRGNVHLQPQGQIKLNGLINHVVDANPASSLSLPNTIRRIETSWPESAQIGERGFFQELKNEWQTLAIGKYGANLIIGYGQTGQEFRAEIGFWILPWRLILAIILLMIVIVAAIKIFYKLAFHFNQKGGVDPI